MDLRPLRSRALFALFALMAAAALAGCAGAEAQPETPESEPSSAPDEDAASSCYQSFRPSLDPASDLQRVAAACATPLGLTAVTPVHIGERQTEEAPADELSFLGKAGRCYRVFSIGEPTVKDLDVAILDAKGRIASADVSDDRFPIVPPSGSLCLHKDERFTIQAAVIQGSGAYLMQVWGNTIKF